MTRSTWLHLRFPFSFFLLPVFLFAFSTLDDVSLSKSLLVFFILHFLLYPASNGYNSYFDKDESSIGGLKSPPRVSSDLYWASLILDGIGLLLGLLLSWQFMIMLFVYGLVSKAYSHPSIRLKKMPIVGWLSAGTFQGYFTFLMTIMGIQDPSFNSLFTPSIQVPALLSSALLLGSYPMTQIYQHQEDGRRGDITLSFKLGVLGTFHFVAIAFLLANAGFIGYYWTYFGMEAALIFQLFMIPMLIFFLWWYMKVRMDNTQANFENTMRLNLLSSLMLNVFFFGFYILS